MERKVTANELESYLSRQGIRCASIHGDKVQFEREKALNDFKRSHITILIATDVASRGLDIPNVSYVLIFDMPTNIDSYVHRIGRTGRIGNTGMAISLIDERPNAVYKDLLDLLEESKQEVPDWFRKLAAGNEDIAVDSFSKPAGGYNKPVYNSRGRGGAGYSAGRGYNESYGGEDSYNSKPSYNSGYSSGYSANSGYSSENQRNYGGNQGYSAGRGRGGRNNYSDYSKPDEYSGYGQSENSGYGDYSQKNYSSYNEGYNNPRGGYNASRGDSYRQGRGRGYSNYGNEESGSRPYSGNNYDEEENFPSNPRGSRGYGNAPQRYPAPSSSYQTGQQYAPPYSNSGNPQSYGSNSYGRGYGSQVREETPGNTSPLYSANPVVNKTPTGISNSNDIQEDDPWADS